MVERDDRRDPVKSADRKWNLLRVALLESNRRSKPSSLGDFLPVRLEDDHLGATRREPLRRRARATSDIKQANPGDRSDQLVQVGNVGGALPNASSFDHSGQDGHECLSGAFNRKESLRNFAAEDLSERLRIDVPSGNHADDPPFSGLPPEGCGNGRTTRAFGDHAVPFDQQTDPDAISFSVTTRDPSSNGRTTFHISGRTVEVPIPSTNVGIRWTSVGADFANEAASGAAVSGSQA